VSEIQNPHDRFFRELFARPEVAAEFLQRYLPDEVADLLAPALPQLRKDSFVDLALQEHFSDLLYEVQLKEGQDAYVYVLFEHKSYPEPLIAFQLLRYLVRIWEQELNQKRRRPFAPIIPLVIYHGQAEWKVPLEFSALIEAPAALRGYVPQFRYHLSDLARYPDEALKGQEIHLRVGLLLLKYIYSQEMPARLPEILSLLRELKSEGSALELLETMLRYVMAASERMTEEVIERALLTAFPDKGGTVMATLAEKWLQQGLEQGREEGLQQAMQANILDVLVTRFGIVPEGVMEAVQRISDRATLQSLLREAVTAESLQDFENVLPRQ
jgi:predicted transposase/invertase (TIGR01784 family)